MPASREARPTIRFVDEYSQLFEELFPEVRSYEAFKLLHLGMISDINANPYLQLLKLSV